MQKKIEKVSVPLLATCKNSNDNFNLNLKKEADQAVDWFSNNHMITNPDKYQATALSKIDSSVSHKLDIHDNNIGTTKSVKLLGI